MGGRPIVPSMDVFCLLGLAQRHLKQSTQIWTVSNMKLAAARILDSFEAEEALLSETFVELNLAVWRMGDVDAVSLVQNLEEEICKKRQQQAAEAFICEPEVVL